METTSLEKRAPDKVEQKRDEEETRHLLPRADVVEKPDSLVLVLDVPGVDNGAVSVSLEGDTLSLQGLVEAAARDGFRLVHCEYEPTSFCREFVLPALRKRGGMTDVHGTKLVVTAAGRFAKRFGFTGFRVARLFHREGRMMCEPVTYHGSGHFAAAALSDGIAVIPPDVHAVEPGETIEFHPWR